VAGHPVLDRQNRRGSLGIFKKNRIMADT
jgi:hypothetical protein